MSTSSQRSAMEANAMRLSFRSVAIFIALSFLAFAQRKRTERSTWPCVVARESVRRWSAGRNDLFRQTQSGQRISLIDPGRVQTLEERFARSVFGQATSPAVFGVRCEGRLPYVFIAAISLAVPRILIARLKL